MTPSVTCAADTACVRRPVVFESALTERFGESRSDVAFLVEFDDSAPCRFEVFFGLKVALEALLGHPVGLVAPAALENPYFAASVTRTGLELHSA